MMLQRVGLAPYFEGRIFSGHETPRSKPHPDVYLAAAAHLQVDPTRCLVVEDTPVGITAGVAAGATVWAYAPPLAPTHGLTQAGATHVFAHMNDLRF
jgi:HAD superfamily hydrolase (TIGR01509 family)